MFPRVWRWVFFGVYEMDVKNTKKYFSMANVEKFLRFAIDVIHDFRKYFDSSFSKDDVKAVEND